MANMLPRIPTVLLALGLLCVLQLSLAQDIICPAELIVVSNGSVDYSELPTTTPVSIPVYNPGGIGGWYSLVGGFVDGIRPGTLPYGKHMSLVWYCNCRYGPLAVLERLHKDKVVCVVLYVCGGREHLCE